MFEWSIKTCIRGSSPSGGRPRGSIKPFSSAISFNKTEERNRASSTKSIRSFVANVRRRKTLASGGEGIVTRRLGVERLWVSFGCTGIVDEVPGIVTVMGSFPFPLPLITLNRLLVPCGGVAGIDFL